MPTPLFALRGVHCERCGYVATPAQHFGCERCGAHGADLPENNLSGEGTVLNAVTVHRSGEESLHIGSVLLDEGPMLRARLTTDVCAGARVRSTLHDAGLIFAALEEKD